MKAEDVEFFKNSKVKEGWMYDGKVIVKSKETYMNLGGGSVIKKIKNIFS